MQILTSFLDISDAETFVSLNACSPVLWPELMDLTTRAQQLLRWATVWPQ